MLQSASASETEELRTDPATTRARYPVHTMFILFTGMLLVVNSHLKDYYPHPAFGGDGLLGYAIFFFSAGIGIGLSFQARTRSFADYYYRRFIRIYPTLWIVMIPTVLILTYPHVHSLSHYFQVWIFPTGNTFVAPLMIDYIPLYFILLPKKPKAIIWSMALLIIPFLILWSQTWPLGKDTPHTLLGRGLWLVANFQLMLLGAYLAFRPPARRDTFARDMVASAVVLIVYIGVKMVFSTHAFRGLFPLLFAIIAVQCYLLFRLACSDRLNRLLGQSPILRLPVLVIGGCSLELYFIHYEVVVQHGSRYLTALPFPLGILAVWAISLPSAYVVARLADWARSGFRHFSWRMPVRAM